MRQKVAVAVATVWTLAVFAVVGYAALTAGVEVSAP